MESRSHRHNSDSNIMKRGDHSSQEGTPPSERDKKKFEGGWSSKLTWAEGPSMKEGGCAPSYGKFRLRVGRNERGKGEDVTLVGEKG